MIAVIIFVTEIKHQPMGMTIVIISCSMSVINEQNTKEGIKKVFRIHNSDSIENYLGKLKYISWHSI